MKILFFTGSGISQESGIPTFRDRMALWENFDPDQIASISAWRKNKEEMLRFHNEFRKLIESKDPNEAHFYISELQNEHEVIVVTQNVDNLHERAGSKNIYHLHGNLFESRSSLNSNLIYPCVKDIKIGDKCERGSQLRPNVVWFGEELNDQLIKDVKKHLMECDVLVVIGTSLEVSPANQLVRLINQNCKIILIDPKPNHAFLSGLKIKYIEKNAIEGISELRKLLQN
jgi:NAD-dependent deacetylase